jgi:hypothetical protein
MLLIGFAKTIWISSGVEMKAKMLVSKKTFSLIALSGLLSGCAGVDFYRNPDLSSPTGIPINYGAKPHLLIVRTNNKEKPVEVSIEYITDPDKVVYAKPKSGFGSSNLTMGLTNGQLTSFGQQTDLKISDLITSLGGFITARAGASKTEAESRQIDRATEQAADETTAAGTRIKEIGGDLSAEVKNNKLKGFIDSEIRDIKSAAKALELAGGNLSNAKNSPSVPGEFEKVKKQIEVLSKIIKEPAASKDRGASFERLKAYIKSLNEVVDSSKPKTQEAQLPTFELYEIIQNASGTSLRAVNPTAEPANANGAKPSVRKVP